MGPSPNPACGEPAQPPRDAAPARLFVAATRMNDGKTTTCLGLYAALRSLYQNVGYIKPVAQRLVEVGGRQIDEDSLLLERIYDLRAPIESMSPVPIDAMFTRRFLADPERLYPILVARIGKAFDRISRDRDFVLIEGTGHAGVGSVFQLSNARVARLLNAKVVLVAQGGIGRPIDEVALNKALFDAEGVEVVGVILNKVEPGKMDVIREFTALGLKRLNVPLLGAIPTAPLLSAPNLGQIVEAIGGRWLNGKAAGESVRIQRVVIGGSGSQMGSEHLRPGVLLVTPGDRESALLTALAAAGVAGEQDLSGILLTRESTAHPQMMELLLRTRIPIVSVEADAYDVASRINGMTVKTQPRDQDKISLIKQMITEHIDIRKMLEML